MMKGYTHVTFVLDNSGSMSHLSNDTIGGYNTFKRKQNEDPGKMTFSLYQFSLDKGIPSGKIRTRGVKNADPTLSIQESVDNIRVLTTYEFTDFKTVPDLTTETYRCLTNTPLLDAIGHAIDQTGKILAALSDEQRPEKIIFVILTDGEENASHHYTHEVVTAKIKHQTEVYNWDFLFMGANQDAIQTGASYGITRGRSMSFTASSASMGSTYGALIDTVSVMKNAVNTKDVNFDEAIRSSVMDGTYESK